MAPYSPTPSTLLLPEELSPAAVEMAKRLTIDHGWPMLEVLTRMLDDVSPADAAYAAFVSVTVARALPLTFEQMHTLAVHLRDAANRLEGTAAGTVIASYFDMFVLSVAGERVELKGEFSTYVQLNDQEQSDVVHP